MGFFKRLLNYTRRIGKQARQQIAKMVGKGVQKTFIETPFRTTGVKLTKDELLHARIAQQAYKKRRLARIGEYSLDSRFSTTTKSLYEKNDGSHIIIGIRGTKDFQDLLTDLEVVADTIQENERFQDDLEYVKRIMAQNRGKLITLSGHSLGAVISDFISVRTGLSGYGFNSPTRNTSSNIEHIVTSNDPISIATRQKLGTKILSTDKTGIQAHKIQTIIDDGQ